MKEIKKLTIHQVFWYFFIFSIIGLIIETIFCLVTTKGILESRQGLIWGPFCPIYGVSASIFIIFLNKHQNKNIFMLFIYGMIIGSISEYIMSYILEVIYAMRFWNYGNEILNLNGRICLRYSLYWGMLSIIIIKFIKPIIDRFINKIPLKFKNILEIILVIFLSIDCIVTVWGIQTYKNRLLNNDIEYSQTNNKIIQVKNLIEQNYFTNERMSKIFPNLRIKDKSGNEIWLKTLI